MKYNQRFEPTRSWRREHILARLSPRAANAAVISVFKKKLLFICSQNRLRSPTAEAIFNEHERLEAQSAGLNNDAVVTVTPELLEWAQVIFVMEKTHRNKLSKKFKPYLKGKRVVCLDIPDDYEFMDPVLIQILKNKVPPLLGTY